MGKYTRRQFITSAGVGMAAVAGLGLAGCAPQTPADKAMANTGNGGTTFADTIAWDGEYDVVVIGFGGAGAVSACYAADAGAKVLLIDKAPQGMEGGNTRFCGQIILNSDDKEAMLAYNKAMAGDFAVDDELMDAYAEGLTQTKTMLRDFFGVPEENFLDWKEDSSAQPMIAMFVPEYPELEGGDALHVLTVSDFNKMANDGYDPAFFRAAETMRAFGEGPFYAIEMIQAFLNTQGGARRNARAEVVGTDGEPIPHLYSAGEFGGMTPYQYNGGGNMAECLIFGQLAGVGAAAEKDPLPVLPMGVASEIVYTQGSGSHEVDPDPAASAKLGENEYLGTSTLCMGNELAVKVKMEGDKIAAIDIVQQQETAGVGSLALEALPARIIEAQSTEVDAVAGATVSSTALKDAVNNALAQVK